MGGKVKVGITGLGRRKPRIYARAIGGENSFTTKNCITRCVTELLSALPLKAYAGSCGSWNNVVGPAKYSLKSLILSLRRRSINILQYDDRGSEGLILWCFRVS